LIWVRLRGRSAYGPAFRRQHPVGRYVADFYCAAARLVIEIDGAGHTEDRQFDHDRRRDRRMADSGLRVMRVPAVDVMTDPDACAQGIYDAAEEIISQRR
jgi:very-short-patch-repair endonuclease